MLLQRRILRDRLEREQLGPGERIGGLLEQRQAQLVAAEVARERGDEAEAAAQVRLLREQGIEHVRRARVAAARPDLRDALLDVGISRSGSGMRASTASAPARSPRPRCARMRFDHANTWYGEIAIA